MVAAPYPKRLIEVDLPIRRISAHARREKSIRHGHISTLHIWWARRPLAACRAVICASLWPDPADEHCPRAFQLIAADRMWRWAREERAHISAESAATFDGVRKHTSAFALTQHPTVLRQALLNFIADFANWDNSTVRAFLDTTRSLTAAAHYGDSADPNHGFVESIDECSWRENLSILSAQLATSARPLVVDPFAGGGSIPLEALRIGADAFASDLNPVAVLLNKVVLEYLPRYGRRLAEAVREWGEWVNAEAEGELARFYPHGEDGSTPIAYLWARTIRCEGPGCGAEVPLIRSLWLAKKAPRAIALQIIPRVDLRRCDFRIIVKTPDGWVAQDDRKSKVASPEFDGTVQRGSATCPCCNYTTPVARIRLQLKARQGGVADARLMCVLTLSRGGEVRSFRLANDVDVQAAENAAKELVHRIATYVGSDSLVPDELISLNEIRRISVPLYGMCKWGELFTPRQLLILTTITRLLGEVEERVKKSDDAAFALAVQVSLGCVLSKVLDRNTAIARWEPNVLCSQQVFGRQAIAMVWDFGEPNILEDCAGSWSSLLDVWLNAVANIADGLVVAARDSDVTIEQANAARHPLPDDIADALVTDPPYYDAVPYSHLSDFFYVWLKRHLKHHFPQLFGAHLAPKDEEIVVDRPHHLSTSTHDIAYYENAMMGAFAEARRFVKPNGIGAIVFASKTTASWEAILKAVIDGGWVITGSWPIDTEMETRMNAIGTATLASSVHLVCRPRENSDGAVRTDEVGDWRDVLQELPKRIHDWMPRLAEEGVVGADAIFACLGPALEIFSRYSRVEKPNGDHVPLKTYLEHVWAAVSKEALSVIFEGADTESFEPDARLTAMWLWTLAGPASTATDSEGENPDDEDEDKAGKKKGGFTLEYDAARKIAQGLGAPLEDLRNMVEVSGETARLLPVAERTAYLFGKDQADDPGVAKRQKKQAVQPDLFAELAQEGVSEQVWSEKTVTKVGQTTLDRIHQSMILFAAGRSDAMKRFLVDDGAGRDQKFWGLAQALSALYPPKSDEKRWVDGVLARKKGLGL